MSTALYVGLIIALTIQSGLALKCYICDSKSKPGCEDMTDASLTAEECNDEKQKELEQDFGDRNRHWLLKISDIYILRSPKSNLTKTCQKLVGINDNQKRSVVRRCQLGHFICGYSKQVLLAQYPKGFQIEFCETCGDMDACNGSTSLQIFGVTIGVAVVVAAYRHLSL